MPINTITGTGGSGKTMILCYFLNKYKYHRQFGNFPVNLPKVEQKSIIDLFTLEVDRDEIIEVFFDEAYGDFDNRMSMDLENIFNTYLPFQARKNNMTMFLITQLDITDYRVRGLRRFHIHALPRKIYNKDGSDFTGDFFFTVYDLVAMKKRNLGMKYEDAKKIFPLFDTKLKIFPRRFEDMKNKIEMKDPKKRLAKIKEIVELIQTKHKLPKDKKSLTHDWVKLRMLDLCCEMNLEPFVYIKLKGSYE